MTMLAFLSMYGLMYMMVDSIVDVYLNVNQLYMAGIMTAPMIILELALMRVMYPNRRANLALMIASAVAGILLIVGIRAQIGVTDRQLVKSMIPHHSSAILMCEEARLQDPKVRELCQSIVASQQAEIDWMRANLR